MTPASANRLVNILLVIALVAFFVFGAMNIMKAISVSENYGLLEAKSTGSATLSVSQDKSQAEVIGTGSAKVWLKPGVYQLAASAKGSQNTQIITVQKQQTTSVNITPSAGPILPSVLNVDFENTDSLINAGLTTEQVAGFKRLVFNYKPAARVVSINSATLQSGPLASNNNERFSYTFIVTIDRVPFAAKISYGDSLNINLTLTNQLTNEQVVNTSTLINDF